MRYGLLAFALLPVLVHAQEPGLLDRRETFGAVLAPAALPDGAMGLYGFVGAPEVGAGFRQGAGGVELELRTKVNYLLLSFALEGAIRRLVLDHERVQLAPTLALGLVYNTGSRYYERYNEQGLSARAQPGLVGTYRVTDTVRLVGLADAPIDLDLREGRIGRFQLLGGGGAEIYLGEDLSLLAAGQLGLEYFKAGGGASHTGLGYSVRLGLGKRLF